VLLRLPLLRFFSDVRFRMRRGVSLLCGESTHHSFPAFYDYRRSTMPFRETAKAVHRASAEANPLEPRVLTFRPVHTGPAEIAAPLRPPTSEVDDDTSYFADTEGVTSALRTADVLTEPAALTFDAMRARIDDNPSGRLVPVIRCVHGSSIWVTEDARADRRRCRAVLPADSTRSLA
jgi:hypothetical protein